MRAAAPSTYELDKLRFYYVELELHSVVWFSSITQPHSEGFVQVMLPVIHNYPLILALKGQIVEETYVAAHNVFKNTKSPAERFNETRIYAYPLTLKKVYYKKVLMSMSETDFVFYKPKTRLIVPILTYYNALAPGTIGSTIIVTAEDVQLPKDFYVRIGVKRYGIWKSLEDRYRVVKPVIKYGTIRLNTLFNVSDVRREDLIEYSVYLRHYAGDIALTGTAKRALEFHADGGEVEVRPIPSFVQS